VSMFKFCCSAALALALSATAMAQDGDPFARAMEDAPAPSGVKIGGLRIPEVPANEPRAAAPVMASTPKPANPLDELARDMNAKPVPPAGPRIVPASADTLPTGPVVVADPAGGPAGPSGDGVDASSEINANYDVTADVYQKILDQQGFDTGSIDKRIAANEEIVSKYKPQLNQVEEELRRIQVDFMNRAFQLRQQKEAGRITDEQFAKALGEEEARWNRRKAGVAGDASFFREETAQAEARLADLKTQKQAMDERIEREGKKKPKKKQPGEAIFEGFSSTLDKLTPFDTRFTMDGNVGCKSCNSFAHSQQQHDEVEGKSEKAEKAEK
jgi:hypothetical protein